MKLKIFLYAICIFVILLIQSTVLDYIEFFDVKPNLLVVFIVSTAFLRGAVEGSVVGFAAGLCQDIVSGKTLGFYALLGLYLGLIIGLMNKRLYRENILLIVFFTFIASIAYEWVVYFFSFFATSQLELVYPLRAVILPEAIYNSLASVFIYIIVIKLNMKLEDVARTSRKF